MKGIVKRRRGGREGLERSPIAASHTKKIREAGTFSLGKGVFFF